MYCIGTRKTLGRNASSCYIKFQIFNQVENHRLTKKRLNMYFGCNIVIVNHSPNSSLRVYVRIKIYILHWTRGGEQSSEIILRVGGGGGEVDYSNDYHFWQTKLMHVRRRSIILISWKISNIGNIWDVINISQPWSVKVTVVWHKQFGLFKYIV